MDQGFCRGMDPEAGPVLGNGADASFQREYGDEANKHNTEGGRAPVIASTRGLWDALFTWTLRGLSHVLYVDLRVELRVALRV